MKYDLPYPSGRSPLLARNIVSTSQPLATQAGVDVLRKGGNAVDAALAAAATLVVVEPTGCGLGGDAFAIVWDGSSLNGLNASGRSPAEWTPERFSALSDMPGEGFDTITVPGVVAGWAELSRSFGRIEFADIFQSAIEYAERGYHVSPTIAKLWSVEAERLGRQPGFAECFMPGGRAPRAGELFGNPALAASLRSIADTHGRSFYEGPLAKKIVEFVGSLGGCLSCEDMAENRPDWCGTIAAEFEGVHLHEIPPNGQGIAALIALGILEHTNIADLEVDSAAALHLQIEAMKIAFADMHAHVGDMASMRIAPDDLLDPEYLSTRAALIDPEQAGEFRAGVPKAGGTVYITAADENGMMISLIQSNYRGFGSGVVVPDTGISLHNRGSDFVLSDGHPNQVGPKKRPLHTIIPGFVMRNGSPLMSFGVMGGGMQAQGHLQMMVRTQLWGQNPQAASDAPRWRVQDGGKLMVERDMPNGTLQSLSDFGHCILQDPPEAAFGFGGAQLIQRIDGGYIAGSDHRKDGAAAGF
ncbi:gamma-glutamyltransferase family protein [Roseovarius confluentis]|uniref:gamma-glutamyltransferase family protein n=1 Tax=Roseovarius confluentis TaxID=1852027 RepID=UPI003C7CF86E